MTTATPVFVVHGALGSARQMQPVAEALGVLGAVHVVELPGHGATPVGAPEEFSMRGFTAALAHAVAAATSSSGTDDVAAGRPVVFGYSMGGYVALALEAASPGTFASIATLGTKFAWTPEVAARDSARLDANVIAAKVPAFARVLEERHAACGGWHHVLESTRGLLHDLGQAPLLHQHSLAGVTIPVCIGVGARDDTVNEEESRQAASWLPNGRCVVLPDVPHPIERVPVNLVLELVRGCINTPPE